MRITWMNARTVRPPVRNNLWSELVLVRTINGNIFYGEASFPDNGLTDDRAMPDAWFIKGPAGEESRNVDQIDCWANLPDIKDLFRTHHIIKHKEQPHSTFVHKYPKHRKRNSRYTWAFELVRAIKNQNQNKAVNMLRKLKNQIKKKYNMDDNNFSPASMMEELMTRTTAKEFDIIESFLCDLADSKLYGNKYEM